MFKVTDERLQLRKMEYTEPSYLSMFDMKVTLLNAPDRDKLREYAPEMAMSTWNNDIDEFNSSISEDDKDRFLFRALQGKFIPTILKTAQVTFKVENMSFHDVTHLIRHSGFSFAADCTGDKLIERPVILPDAVVDTCFEKYHKAMKLLNECYVDMVNAGCHIQDARLALPRTATTFYYVTGSLDYTMQFIRQRLDRQVQPKSDNIMALKLLIELCKAIPELYFLIDPEGPSKFYADLLHTNFVSRFDKPLSYNSKDKENEDKLTYAYDKHRDEMPGGKEFALAYEQLLKLFYKNKADYIDKHPEILHVVSDCTKGDWK